ncbi:hypothetical protein E2C01_032992 [Portunus trituberculatus]|uniref:Uncharacterized protein n=1 Tax=Portunus trituberculatus TaxID=210409 RepID=A0A5B7F182_PORTR|nr:hypothetical protein [Portunus trituberculatus]
METKSCNRKSKSCLAKYGIFYRFVYTRDLCSVNSCSARMFGKLKNRLGMILGRNIKCMRFGR